MVTITHAHLISLYFSLSFFHTNTPFPPPALSLLALEQAHIATALLAPQPHTFGPVPSRSISSRVFLQTSRTKPVAARTPPRAPQTTTRARSGWVNLTRKKKRVRKVATCSSRPWLLPKASGRLHTPRTKSQLQQLSTHGH